MSLVVRVLLLGGFVINVVAFQNCSPVNFASEQPEKQNQAQGTQGPQDGAPGTNTEVGILPENLEPEICDPLAENSGRDDGSSCIAGQGLRGKIYYFDDTTPDLGSKKLDDYFKYGHKIDATIAFSKVDIAPRRFDEGFPTGGGDFVKKGNGDKLFEWFAMDLIGAVKLAGSSGDYQFALVSDDGAILEVEGQKVIDQDGTRAVTWGCSSAPIQFQDGVAKKMRLQYFQGPRFEIALRLLWRPWANSAQPCNDSGGFVPVPAEVLLSE